MPNPPHSAPKAPGHDLKAPWGWLETEIPGRAWAPGQGLSQEEREGPHSGWAGEWEFLAALATIQRVQGCAWSCDRGARVTMAGHPKPLGGVGWGGGMVLEWVEQTEVCCEGSCRLDTDSSACLSWSRCLSPAATAHSSHVPAQSWSAAL